MEQPGPLYDGKLAAKLGRISWVVLVTSFVLLMGARLSPALRDGLLALLAAVTLALNFPSALGVFALWRQGERSRPLSALTLVLLLRLFALGLVLWVVGSQ